MSQHRSRLVPHWVPRAARSWRLWLVAVAVLYVGWGFYFVPADQQAVVLRFGRVLGTPSQPGLHWTWPPPIGDVKKLRVRETRRVTVGFAGPDRVLGRDVAPAVAQFLTGDRNLLNVRLVAQYAVRDPVAFLFRFTDAEQLIGNTVESALSSVVRRRGVDSLLTTEKIAAQQEVHALTQELLDRYGAGISVLGMSLESIAPPEEVREAFNGVASAREDRNRIVREAQSYANELLPVSRGEASRMLREAEAYAESRVATASGDASRFSSLAAEHRKVPRETATRLYLETMEEVLPRMQKTIVESGAGSIDFDFLRSGP